MKRCLTLTATLLLLVALVLPAMAGTEGMFPPGSGVSGGTGTLFEVVDPTGRTISVTSDKDIRTMVQTAAGVVELGIEPVGTAANATITLRGFTPVTTYYKYEDHLYNKSTFTTDEQGAYSYFQDVSAPHAVFIKDTPSTLFLAATPWSDGSGVPHNAGWSDSYGADLNGIIGTWDAATMTAQLVSDVHETIEIVHSGITLDGNGHTTSGEGQGYPGPYQGVYFTNVGNVTIRNLTFLKWANAINYRSSGGNTIAGNTFIECGNGIYNYAGWSNTMRDNTFERCSRAMVISIYSGNNTVRGNRATGGNFGMYFLGYTMSNDILDNYFGNNVTGLYLYNSDYNKFTGNTLEGNQTGLLLDYNTPYPPDYIIGYAADYNRVINNNFIANGVQAIGYGVGNIFSLPRPDGGNHWSNWTGMDLDGDGIVDQPYVLYDREGRILTLDEFPWVRRDGWKINLPPVFQPVAPVETTEYELVEFRVAASDPEGGQMTALTVTELPAGASFNAATGTFSWRPDGNQAGVHVVSFFATDNGTPAATGQLDVVITVGEVTSPTNLSTMLVEDIASYSLPADVTNSYVANLGKTEAFIAGGQVNAAVNQYEAFIHKLAQDVETGRISESESQWLASMARDAIALLTAGN